MAQILLCFFNTLLFASGVQNSPPHYCSTFLLSTFPSYTEFSEECRGTQYFHFLIPPKVLLDPFKIFSHIRKAFLFPHITKRILKSFVSMSPGALETPYFITTTKMQQKSLQYPLIHRPRYQSSYPQSLSLIHVPSHNCSLLPLSSS